MSRLARNILVCILLLGAGYLYACWHVYENLDEFFLTTNYVLELGSETNPVTTPMPNWIRDAYWISRGQARVFAKNRETVDYLTALSGRISWAQDHNERLEENRARRLLTDLVCTHRLDAKKMNEIVVFHKKMPNKILAEAIMRCRGELS